MKTCKQCEKDITRKHPNAKFCGLKCKDRYHNTHNPRGYGVRPERNIEDEMHPLESYSLGQWDD